MCKLARLGGWRCSVVAKARVMQGRGARRPILPAPEVGAAVLREHTMDIVRRGAAARPVCTLASNAHGRWTGRWECD